MTEEEDLADHVEQLIVMYHRSNSAAQLAEDIMRMTNPVRWRAVSKKMLDKDFILDNEPWQGAVNKRDRRFGRETKGLPSTATRVVCAHMMATAAAAYELLNETEDAFEESRDDLRLARDEDPPEGGWDMDHTVARVAELSGGRCEAEGHHDPQCPGQATPDNERFFSFHHIFTRESAKKYKVASEIVDRPSNVILVWNGYTSLGAGGCHGKIHREATAARAAGLLAPKGATSP